MALAAMADLPEPSARLSGKRSIRGRLPPPSGEITLTFFASIKVVEHCYCCDYISLNNLKGTFLIPNAEKTLISVEQYMSFNQAQRSHG